MSIFNFIAGYARLHEQAISSKPYFSGSTVKCRIDNYVPLKEPCIPEYLLQ